jgi:hypothetical protein
MVVLEDVDLVATDRDYAPDGNPLLFSLLEAMDGVGADADVTFVLTTNRADILETALADRPGRVDLAVEIPRPDARCRERLLGVYARDLTVDADLEQVVAGTEGVTASFIKEMIRRAVLASLQAGRAPAGAARRALRRRARRDELRAPGAHPLATRRGRRGTRQGTSPPAVAGTLARGTAGCRTAAAPLTPDARAPDSAFPAQGQYGYVPSRHEWHRRSARTRSEVAQAPHSLMGLAARRGPLSLDPPLEWGF